MGDLEKARLNRERVAKKENIEGYLELELALRHYPASRPLPKSWVGVLPEILKDIRVDESGDPLERIVDETKT